MRLYPSFFLFQGHGDSNSRNIPTLVKDISNVGEVSCGSSHTIALSKDGRTVWSFGGGDNGAAFLCFFLSGGGGWGCWGEAVIWLALGGRKPACLGELRRISRPEQESEAQGQ